MVVRVCSLPFDSLGSILSTLLRFSIKVHFLPSKVRDLHVGEAFRPQFVDDKNDEDDCQQEHHSRNDSSLPNRVFFALRSYVAVRLSVDVVAARVISVAVQSLARRHPSLFIIPKSKKYQLTSSLFSTFFLLLVAF